MPPGDERGRHRATARHETRTGRAERRPESDDERRQNGERQRERRARGVSSPMSVGNRPAGAIERMARSVSFATMRPRTAPATASSRTFDHHLADQPPARRAECLAQRDFTLANRAAREEEIRDVDAADEQHESRCGEQHVERARQAEYELVAKKTFGRPPGDCRIRRGDARRDRQEIGLRRIRARYRAGGGRRRSACAGRAWTAGMLAGTSTSRRRADGRRNRNPRGGRRSRSARPAGLDRSSDDARSPASAAARTRTLERSHCSSPSSGSPSWNTRPRRGRARSTSKKFGVTVTPARRSGGLVVRAGRRRRRVCGDVGEAARLLPPIEIVGVRDAEARQRRSDSAQYSSTRSSPRGNGSGRSSTASTTLKIAVFAPIAIASVRTTIAVKAGKRRASRRA